MPDTIVWDMQSQRAPALAFDRAVGVGDYATAGDAGNNTITDTKSVTTTWTFKMDLGAPLTLGPCSRL